MKFGLAQINTTVGDLAGNRHKILEAYHHLVDAGADLVLFPELAVCGYPPRDLLFKRRFVPDVEESLLEIASETGTVPAVIGFVETNPEGEGRPFFNAAAWCQDGEVRETVAKCLLPTYDVFDEDRYFQAAEKPCVISWRGMKVGITICEDIWTHSSVPAHQHYRVKPLDFLANQDIDLLLNLSASPWHAGKTDVRETLLIEAARHCRCPTLYCNAVGGNDELIFDGRSIAADETGELIAGAAGFEEALLLVDLESRQPSIHPTHRQTNLADIHDALVLGLKDYMGKSGFSRAILGLSGGIDSAVTAAIAVEVLGSNNVTGVSLPSNITSEGSRNDAAQLARNLGIHFHTLPISEVVQSAENALAPLFEGLSRDVTEENLQARSRGLLLMALSNKFGALLLSTGNKSEMAVGYCTLYGDMAGGMAVISDVPKMQVYALAEYINRDHEWIPRSTITKPPSAELRPDQKDEDTLPPYPVLDAILQKYVEEGWSSRDLEREGYDKEVIRDIIRRVDLNEYKRKQAPPGLKLTPLAFGVGRRLPIVQKYIS